MRSDDQAFVLQKKLDALAAYGILLSVGLMPHVRDDLE
jgi:hypothetical protein